MTKKVVDIGASEKNTDWIKAGEGHKGEKALHAALASKLKKKRKKPPNGR